MKVRFNITVRFRIGGGGGGVGWGLDHRRSGGRLKPGASAAGWKAEQAQQREMFTELSTPKMLRICAAAARSDRSLSQLCSQLQQVCCGASCERPGKLLCTTPNREYAAGPYFLTGVVSGNVKTIRANSVNFFFPFFFSRQSDLVHGLAWRTSACFCTAGGESIGKHDNIEAILGGRGRS